MRRGLAACRGRVRVEICADVGARVRVAGVAHLVWGLWLHGCACGHRDWLAGGRRGDGFRVRPVARGAGTGGAGRGRPAGVRGIAVGHAPPLLDGHGRRQLLAAFCEREVAFGMLAADAAGCSVIRPGCLLCCVECAEPP